MLFGMCDSTQFTSHQVRRIIRSNHLGGRSSMKRPQIRLLKFCVILILLLVTVVLLSNFWTLLIIGICILVPIWLFSLLRNVRDASLGWFSFKLTLTFAALILFIGSSLLSF